jgi:hypothetical protein
MLYNWKRDDHEFSEAWEDALRICCDDVEATLYQIATQGTERVVRHKGRIVGRYRDFSDSTKAGLALLRVRRPEVYGDGPRKSNARGFHYGRNVEARGGVDAPVENAIRISVGNREELDAALAAMRKKPTNGTPPETP